MLVAYIFLYFETIIELTLSRKQGPTLSGASAQFSRLLMKMLLKISKKKTQFYAKYATLVNNLLNNNHKKENSIQQLHTCYEIHIFLPCFQREHPFYFSGEVA